MTRGDGRCDTRACGVSFEDIRVCDGIPISVRNDEPLAFDSGGEDTSVSDDGIWVTVFVTAALDA